MAEATSQPDPDRELAPDERELLAAFDRLAPQGSLRWGFDDALRRVDQPDQATAAGALPWKGLPDDLWDRGRSARIGRRFVGDVAGVLAELLAADAREVADAAVTAVNGDRFVATWDALRYLAARVDALEHRADPFGLAVPELGLPVPDLSEWAGALATWCAPVAGCRQAVVGEICDGSALGALVGTGLEVRAVDPDGARIWDAFATPAAREQVELVLDEVALQLATFPDGSLAAVVLASCVDRLDDLGKTRLLAESARAVVAGGSVVVLASDPPAWERTVTAPACDLVAGRPWHPETWTFLLERNGASETHSHRAERGTVHAVVARFDR